MINALRARLTLRYRDRIVWLPLEHAIERGLTAACGFHADHLRRFRQRYLNYGQIERLLSCG